MLQAATCRSPLCWAAACSSGQKATRRRRAMWCVAHATRRQLHEKTNFVRPLRGRLPLVTFLLTGRPLCWLTCATACPSVLPCTAGAPHPRHLLHPEPAGLRVLRALHARLRRRAPARGAAGRAGKGRHLRGIQQGGCCVAQRARLAGCLSTGLLRATPPPSQLDQHISESSAACCPLPQHAAGERVPGIQAHGVPGAGHHPARVRCGRWCG